MRYETNQSEIQVNRSWRFWYAVMSGPVLWAVHLMISYGLGSDACQKGYLVGSTVLGINALSLVLSLLTLAALVGVAFGLFLAYGYWQDARRSDQSGMGQPEGRLNRFLAFTGLVLNGIFGVAILLSVLPLFFLNPCS